MPWPANPTTAPQTAITDAIPTVNSTNGGSHDRPRSRPSRAIELSPKISGIPHGVKIIVAPDTNARARPTDKAVTLVVPTVASWRRRANRLTGSKNAYSTYRRRRRGRLSAAEPWLPQQWTVPGDRLRRPCRSSSPLPYEVAPGSRSRGSVGNAGNDDGRTGRPGQRAQSQSDPALRDPRAHRTRSAHRIGLPHLWARRHRTAHLHPQSQVARTSSR